jgi:hypothetical protein
VIKTDSGPTASDAAGAKGQALQPMQESRGWIGVESTAALVSSLFVAPFVAIIDRAIVSNASGRQKLVPALVEGLGTLLHPQTFVKQKSFQFVWAVYFGTYLTANLTHGWCDVVNQSWQWPTFVASSVANVSLSLWKDTKFAKMFAAAGRLPAPLPPIAYGLFGIRDCLTVAASFNLPVIVADRLKNVNSNWIKGREFTLAQLSVPMAVQFISTPLHLMALDYYNRPTLKQSLKVQKVTGTPVTEKPPSILSRANFVVQEYPTSVLARMARILPAFGIGGVLNSRLRRAGYERLSHAEAL